MELDSDYADDTLSQYSMISQTPTISSRASVFRDDLPPAVPRRGSIVRDRESMTRQSSVSRMLMSDTMSHTARAPSISRSITGFANKIKSLDMMLDEDDRSSISSRYSSINSTSRYSTSNLRKSCKAFIINSIHLVHFEFEINIIKHLIVNNL